MPDSLALEIKHTSCAVRELAVSFQLAEAKTSDRARNQQALLGAVVACHESLGVRGVGCAVSFWVCPPPDCF